MYPNGVDPHVLGYLGRALSLELSAVQLYSTQARLVATWGLEEAARRFDEEAREELGHAQRIITRMLALGVSPGASQLRPVSAGATLHELLRQDHAFENELVGLYAEAARLCARNGDHDNRLFFEALLNEERAHGEELSRWIDELEKPAGTRAAR